MKLLMITGGLLGFGIGLTLGWVRESSWPTILWRASLGACLGGLLLRWWGRQWVAALRESLRQRQEGGDRGAAPETAPTAAKS